MTGASDLPDPGSIRISADEAAEFLSALGSISDEQLVVIKSRLSKAVDDAADARSVALAVIEALTLAPSVLKILKGL